MGTGDLVDQVVAVPRRAPAVALIAACVALLWGLAYAGAWALHRHSAATAALAPGRAMPAAASAAPAAQTTPLIALPAPPALKLEHRPVKAVHRARPRVVPALAVVPVRAAAPVRSLPVRRVVSPPVRRTSTLPAAPAPRTKTPARTTPVTPPGSGTVSGGG